MIRIGYVPISFGQSYTVHIVKSSCNVYGKVVTVDDFRGVSISPVISKVFEHCILDRYEAFFKRVTTSSALKTHRLCVLTRFMCCGQ